MASAMDRPDEAEQTSQTCGGTSVVSERMTGQVEVGALVRDSKRNQVARVMGHGGPYVQLRPPSGGCEWDARPEDVQPITPSEALSARVAEANAWSRRGRL